MFSLDVISSLEIISFSPSEQWIVINPFLPQNLSLLPFQGETLDEKVSERTRFGEKMKA